MLWRKMYCLIIDRRRRKDALFLSKILIHSCMIMLYIMEEKNFVVAGCKLLVPKKYVKVLLKTAVKLMVNKLLRSLRRVNILNSKTVKEK